ncbi:flagellar hook-basal body protein [Paenibacillus turpanensis]|uniref:flagellar hook-basal body protein n=1 Tax=Paenibacillus turpanensis TaxID=2689078 RepID=UPI001408CB82|nr:flagellar hook-basal body protein [Paenibacillus turpanensis]
MLRGLGTAAAGMISQQRKHDTITNNIANINTPGYKQGNSVNRSFPEMLIALSGGGNGTNNDVKQIGRLNTGVFAEEEPFTFVQGELYETKNPSDFAIASFIEVPGVQFDASGKAVQEDGTKIFRPQAFFTVADANNELRFTRNGKFTVDSAGQLVTGDGLRVVDQNMQPIVIQGRSISEVKANERGQLFSAFTGEPILNAAGQAVQLRISVLDNPNDLIREGNGNFRLANADDIPEELGANDRVQVSQGFIERSNVDANQSMVDMMAALRAYEANQKVVQFYDRSLEKLVNEVGRV